MMAIRCSVHSHMPALAKLCACMLKQSHGSGQSCGCYGGAIKAKAYRTCSTISSAPRWRLQPQTRINPKERCMYAVQDTRNVVREDVQTTTFCRVRARVLTDKNLPRSVKHVARLAAAFVRRPSKHVRIIAPQSTGQADVERACKLLMTKFVWKALVGTILPRCSGAKPGWGNPIRAQQQKIQVRRAGMRLKMPHLPEKYASPCKPWQLGLAALCTHSQSNTQPTHQLVNTVCTHESQSP